MLQLGRLSLAKRQSNPSILIAGLLPTFPPTGPTFLSDEGKSDDLPDAGIGITERPETGETLSSLNRESCTNGLDTLLGGDPLKKGGGEATFAHVFSDAPYMPSFSKMISKRSMPALDSYGSG